MTGSTLETRNIITIGDGKRFMRFMASITVSLDNICRMGLMTIKTFWNHWMCLSMTE